MNQLSAVWAWVTKHTLFTLGIIIVLLIGGFFYVRNGSEGEHTLTITHRDFIQEVSVSGKVVAAQTVDLAFSQTGRVGSVFARVGDTVDAGTVLASIENGDVRGEVLQKEAALEAAQADLNALKRGARPEEIAVSQASVDAAQATLIDAQKTLVEKISDAYIKSDDAVRSKSDQMLSNPRTQNPQLLFEVESSQELDLLNRRVALESVLSLWSERVTNNPYETTLVDDSVTYLSQVKTFLEKLTLALNSTSVSASVTQTTLDGWISDVSTARTNVSTATTNLVGAVGDVASAQAALTLAEKELILESSDATLEEIQEQEAQVKAARADLVSARARYQKTLVVAPFTGIVSRMDAKVGGVASSNESLISMISADDLEIESFVPEINAPLISIEDPAIVTLDAYGEAVPFGAKIVRLDPAETIRDGVSTYRAIFHFLENDIRIKSGMTANIKITTEEKAGVIAVPQGIVMIKDGTRIVYVKEGEGFVPRTVTVGSVSSFGDIEILSGLREGDVVLLTPPRQ